MLAGRRLAWSCISGGWAGGRPRCRCNRGNDSDSSATGSQPQHRQFGQATPSYRLSTELVRGECGGRTRRQGDDDTEAAEEDPGTGGPATPQRIVSVDLPECVPSDPDRRDAGHDAEHQAQKPEAESCPGRAEHRGRRDVTSSSRQWVAVHTGRADPDRHTWSPPAQAGSQAPPQMRGVPGVTFDVRIPRSGVPFGEMDAKGDSGESCGARPCHR